jgi:hypothetical protein
MTLAAQAGGKPDKMGITLASIRTDSHETNHAI